MSSDDADVRRRAGAALQVRRPEEARRLLAGLLATSPDDARAHGLMAMALVGVGAPWAQWRAHADRAVALASSDLGLLVDMAEMARKAGDIGAARRYVDRAIVVAPDDVRALNVLALVQQDEGDDDGALRTSQTVLSRAPDDPAVIVAHGVALAKKGRLVEAQEQYLAALAIDPHNAFALNNLAVARLRCGDLAQASRLLQAVVHEDPRFTLARTNVDAVGATARRLALALLMMVLGLSFVAGLVSPWIGALVGVAGVAWVMVDLFRLPSQVRRRLAASAGGWDLFWTGLILFGAASLVAGFMSGEPGSSLFVLYAFVIGLRISAPVIYRRLVSAWGLRRRGLRLP